MTPVGNDVNDDSSMQPRRGLQTTSAQEDEICFVGFVMDTYCIDRGRLFDNSDIDALVEPDRHSIHCLVDVDRCVYSGYEMLVLNNNKIPSTPTDTTHDHYCRAFALDSRGNELMLDLARTTGEAGSFCTTCTGPPGSQTRGFRAAATGRILPSGNNNLPILQVTAVAPANVGCAGKTYVPVNINCDSGSYLPFIATHGSLMLMSWGFLLPMGILAARLLRHYEESALWFKIHRVVQPMGLLLAITGWIVALAGPFDVLGSGVYDASFAHGLIGTIVMALGILQPVNAYLRPHKPENGQTKSTARGTWEWIHKGAGYFAALAGLVNCFLGMALSGKYEDYFFSALIISVVTMILVAILACCSKRCVPSTDPEKDHDNEDGPGPSNVPENNENIPLTE